MFSVLLVAFLSVLILYYLYKEYGTKITRFPIIGSFHMLFTNPKPLIEQIQYDRHKYGDITYFKLINIDLGKILSLITLMATCSSFSISKQHKIDKTDGWDGPVCWEVIVYGKIQISRWEEERSFGSRSKTLVNFISSKIESKEDFFVKDIFNIPVVNVIWRMVANKTFQMDGSEGQMFVRTLDEILSKRDMKTAIPIIGQYMPVFRRRKELMRQMKDSMMNIINEHEKTLGI